MKVAVSGSRHGPRTPDQRASFRRVLGVLLQQTREANGDFELWHGACVGVDEFAHRLICPLIYPQRVVIHALPGYGVNLNQMDFPYRMKDEDLSRPGVFIAASAPYGTRNAELVRVCDVLAAVPAAPEGSHTGKRSGTWQTVRMARARRRPIVLVRPDGSIEIEGGTVNDSP